MTQCHAGLWRDVLPKSGNQSARREQPQQLDHELSKDNVFHGGGLGTKKESAVLLGVLKRDDARRDLKEPLSELAMLAETAEILVKDQVVQKLDRPHPATYAGSGTVAMLAKLAKEVGADTIICDNDLSPAQSRTLQKTCQMKVVDRTDLILDIFARHAKTLQARLQVELAQLKYARPRLRKMWTHLAGEQGGVGFRGPGEKQLELDKRMIDDRIRDLKQKLTKIRQRKIREVSSRSEIHTIALVGYTNAGKSTLFGKLTDSEKETYVANKLFATLDTKTRPIQVKTRVRGVLSDTVGFIDHLPHHLIESFHATLEEVLQAHLLIHVVDLSGADPIRHLKSVNQVLKQIGLGKQPTIMALNKADQVDPALLPYFLKRIPRSVAVSGLTGMGFSKLREMIAEQLTALDRPCQITAALSEGRFIAAVDARASELEQHYEADSLIMKARISPDFLKQARHNVRNHQNISWQWLSEEP